mmetsp:Transcript_25800/g.53640  ORF Transcript_25800/g.53640 Transcript_25800/m.53640 type:complete len:430 (-) Transcript_25800:2930-4219(-)
MPTGPFISPRAFKQAIEEGWGRHPDHYLKLNLDGIRFAHGRVEYRLKCDQHRTQIKKDKGKKSAFKPCKVTFHLQLCCGLDENNVKRELWVLVLMQGAHTHPTTLGEDFNSIPITWTEEHIVERFRTTRTEKKVQLDIAVRFLQDRMANDPGALYALISSDSGGVTNGLYWVNDRTQETRDLLLNHGDNDLILLYDATLFTNNAFKCCCPFTVVDKNGKNIILAVGLIHGETTENHTWALRQFKISFPDFNPAAIMTDSAPSIRAAVLEVYPEARHHLCSWHIYKNLYVKLKKCKLKRGFEKKVKAAFWKMVKESDRYQNTDEAVRQDFENLLNLILDGTSLQRSANVENLLTNTKPWQFSKDGEVPKEGDEIYVTWVEGNVEITYLCKVEQVGNDNFDWLLVPGGGDGELWPNSNERTSQKFYPETDL